MSETTTETDTTKKPKLFVSLILALIGGALIGDAVGFQVVVGVFFMLWSNNIGQDLRWGKQNG